MRTPNTKCTICDKQLYRRPFEFKKGKEFCCVGCRSQLYKKRKPSVNLELGREKGTNHLQGIPKSLESNLKRSLSYKEWCKENEEKIKERGKKTRAENHYNWKGGISNLNQSIRQMNEYRNWQRKAKKKYKVCPCGSNKSIEIHHIKPLKDIIELNNIKSRDDARKCNELWSIDNAIGLCKKCHYKIENRKYNDND